MIDLHRIHSLQSMQRDVGKTFKVLVEGFPKKVRTICMEELIRIKLWFLKKEI